MWKILFIGLGGFLGALARYGLSGWVQRRAGELFPFGTLAVNVAGCFAIGVLMSLVEFRQLFTPGTRAFLMIGLLGAFTTFSTLGYETTEFIEDGAWLLAAANVAANAVLGVAAVVFGRALIKALIA